MNAYGYPGSGDYARLKTTGAVFMTGAFSLLPKMSLRTGNSSSSVSAPVSTTVSTPRKIWAAVRLMPEM